MPPKRNRHSIGHRYHHRAGLRGRPLSQPTIRGVAGLSGKVVTIERDQVDSTSESQPPTTAPKCRVVAAVLCWCRRPVVGVHHCSSVFFSLASPASRRQQTRRALAQAKHPKRPFKRPRFRVTGIKSLRQMLKSPQLADSPARASQPLHTNDLLRLKFSRALQKQCQTARCRSEMQAEPRLA
jgi:hypothetical protein